jgi:hypothetical protein
LRPVLLLDIRSSEEYNNSHCFGAASVPVNARAIEAALEAGMATAKSLALELFNLINAQLLRPPENVAGLFDGVFNRKVVHHERFLDREHSIVCVYSNHSLPPSSSSSSEAAQASDAAAMPIAKRVASAIALHSSSEFTCFYISDSFDSFRQLYAFAVQTDSGRQQLGDPEPEGAAASNDQVIVADGDTAAEAYAPTSAAEFNFKGCPPLCVCF